ncbi:hypothetical protein C8Q70DRAFT_925263 [Cubamyces menziesii]|uniref:F-box domain-containing protein n=1 Tax=Trametes cubensis TaxID=1111947 RepID=A0AAD7TY20_9APHY|nr:hypothetical protein C8Q70DRAFT_925263 [Cubamyces menziesii]KAJ8486843.1 hypothetical protein ONZ51_g4581 [Trametes cubensis]
MAPPLPVLHPRTLPNELIHCIIHEAWFSLVDYEWGDRWELYRSLSLVSRLWRDIMTTVALRCVMIQTPQDFSVYRHLVTRRWGLDPETTEVERAAPAARDYFQRSELHIVVSDWSCPSFSGFYFATDYPRIPCYIPACKHISVIIKELPSNDRFVLPYQPLFNFLSQYTTTKEVYLLWTYTHINRYILPTDEVRGVTYLRVHEYPRCVCHNYSRSSSHKHDSDCFSYHLPMLFPNLEHLHLDSPYILKCLETPPTLTKLTLEAPPIHYLPSLGHFSSLMGWNIVSALACGLFKRDDRDFPRKKIVVNTGPTDPTGWRQALAACQEHGVELELRHVYLNPPQPSRPIP